MIAQLLFGLATLLCLEKAFRCRASDRRVSWGCSAMAFALLLFATTMME